MKTRFFAFLMIMCISFSMKAQSTWSFSVTYDSLKIYFIDTAHGVSETYSRCGLSVVKTQSWVTLYTTNNTPINKWVYGYNLPFLAPTVDSGYSLLNGLAFSNCVGTNTLIPYADTTPLGPIATAAYVQANKGTNYWTNDGSATWLTDVSQSLGIGNTNPQAKLDISGSFNVLTNIDTSGTLSHLGSMKNIFGSPFSGAFFAYEGNDGFDLGAIGNTPIGNHTFWVQVVNGIELYTTNHDIVLNTGGGTIQTTSGIEDNNNHVETNLTPFAWYTRHGHNSAIDTPRWFMDSYEYGPDNTAISGGVFTGYGQGFSEDSTIHSGYYKCTQDTAFSVFGKPTSGVLIQTKDSNGVQRFVANDNGSLIINDGNQAQGRVLTSDDNGIASWQAGGWGLTGNAGTDPATNFLGTTDGAGFNIRTNNVQMLHLDEGSTNPNIVIGASTAPSAGQNDISIGNNVSIFNYDVPNYAIAIGSGASIGSRQGIAIGAGSQTSGFGNVGNMAIGYRAVSVYNGSTAIGYNAYNTTLNQFAIGAAQSSIFAPGMASAVGSVLTDDGTGIFTSQSPVSAGATGSEPSTPFLGQFFFDTSLVKMKFWNGTVWAVITSTP